MRSFTTRRKQAELDGSMQISILGRAASQRGGRPVARAQISAPVALVSTTNMLSYNAPDIAGTKPIEHRDTSSSSSEESDGGSGGSLHSQDTEPTDISSPEASPTCAEPEPNHLSQYFKDGDMPKPEASPTLPRRAASHSKRAHEALSRKRSVQRERAISPINNARSISRTRASIDMFTSEAAAAPRENPFGKELAQLDAVVEEFSAARTEAQSESLWLRSRGLACLPVSDYLDEIDGLVTILLDDRTPTVPDFSGWF